MKKSFNKIHKGYQILEFFQETLTIPYPCESSTFTNLGGALGYPTHSLSTLQPFVGYPSRLLKCCTATVREKCTRFPKLRGRLINFAPWLKICSGQIDMRVRYLGRGKNSLGARSSLVSGLRYFTENGNSKKFSQYFLSKLSFDKLSWLIVIYLGKIFRLLLKVVFWVQVRVFME